MCLFSSAPHYVFFSQYSYIHAVQSYPRNIAIGLSVLCFLWLNIVQAWYFVKELYLNAFWCSLQSTI